VEESQERQFCKQLYGLDCLTADSSSCHRIVVDFFIGLGLQGTSFARVEDERISRDTYMYTGQY
jgi:hypothetical protein